MNVHSSRLAEKAVAPDETSLTAEFIAFLTAVSATLAFNPWHALPDHPPLSGFLARRDICRAMAAFRSERQS